MRFSKVIVFDITLDPQDELLLNNSNHNRPPNDSSKHSDVIVSVEEIQVHHYLTSLHQQSDSPEHRQNVDRLHSLYHQMHIRLHTEGGPIRPHEHAKLQRLCHDAFGEHTVSENTANPPKCSLDGNPKLVACLMGAIGGYHGEYKCRPDGGNDNTPCPEAVRCGIIADQGHNGQIDESEHEKYRECLRSRGIAVNESPPRPSATAMIPDDDKDVNSRNRQEATEVIGDGQPADDRLSAYNAAFGTKSPGEIIEIGPGHLLPDLWRMESAGTGGEYQAFKCWKSTRMSYLWRVSKGENVSTV